MLYCFQGRRCDEVEDFYFTGPLDYLSVEAELAEILIDAVSLETKKA